MRTPRASARLTFDDYLKLLIPSRLYYPHKVAKSIRSSDPELALLRDFVPAKCTAIDIGANRGVYSYALSRIAARVEAFEPYPALAKVIRAKLSPTVRVHEVALSDSDGSATFYIPKSETGREGRLGGSLAHAEPGTAVAELDVRIATLDGYGFENVGFIKMDTEGTELKIIAGAQRTIARDRPALLVELITSVHDTRREIEQIRSMFGYDAWIVIGPNKVDAQRALDDMPDAVKTCNVLFTPRSAGS
jgi:FkbM family methyltransferase